MKNNKYNWIVWVIIYGTLVFLTLNKHSRFGNFNYHNEIWADKAGYYVYLPAALKYDFNATEFPDSIEVKTGNGFILNRETHQVQTKYTYGVSLLQLPFYLVANQIAPIISKPTNGFSEPYQKALNFAAITYFLLGLILLFQILKDAYSKRVSIWVLSSLFLGTNLYYYVVSATGMSHVYSFFLFTVHLYFLSKTNFLLRKPTRKQLFFLGLISGLIILIRPTNILFLTSFLFVFSKNADTIIKRFKNVLNPSILIPIVLGIGLIFIPQIVYWKYAFGTWLKYSYQNEGFNWLSPNFMGVWFSPNNGLFLYGSFYIIIFFSLVYSAIQKAINWYYLVLFLAISYITASWWAWDFGCSYGSRNFVEYLVVFAIPLGSLITYITKSSTALKLLSILTLAIIVILNFILVYAFDDCYFGEGSWDWPFYYHLITG